MMGGDPSLDPETEALLRELAGLVGPPVPEDIFEDFTPTIAKTRDALLMELDAGSHPALAPQRLRWRLELGVLGALVRAMADEIRDDGDKESAAALLAWVEARVDERRPRPP